MSLNRSRTFADLIRHSKSVILSIWFSYIVALSCNAAAWGLGSLNVSTYQLRGGIFVLLALYLFTALISLLAIILVWLSRRSRLSKFGLTLPIGVSLTLLAPIMAQYLFAVLFFGPGWCSTTFTSPSGRQTITIEESCFLDCTQIVYRDSFVFQQEIGALNLRSGKVCRARNQMILEWNADETEIAWKFRQDGGSFSLTDR